MLLGNRHKLFEEGVAYKQNAQIAVVGELISIQSSTSTDRVMKSESLYGGSGGRGFNDRMIGGGGQKWGDTFFI